MTDTIPEGEFDPNVRLDHARRTYALIKDNLLTRVNAVKRGEDIDKHLKEMTTELASFQKALLQLQTLEADLEKRGELTRATRATALDLATAKAEIHLRLARFKERSTDR